jgi:hypothetical protein
MPDAVGVDGVVAQERAAHDLEVRRHAGHAEVVRALDGAEVRGRRRGRAGGRMAGIERDRALVGEMVERGRRGRVEAADKLLGDGECLLLDGREPPIGAAVASALSKGRG